jgi:thiamine kinase-like enzyme
MGMDCLNFVFNYADLGPTNIIVKDKPNSGKVRIIDFEIAGYFPQSWIRTKF